MQDLILSIIIFGIILNGILILLELFKIIDLLNYLISKENKED